MKRRLFINRRDAHQAADRQMIVIPAKANKFIHIARQDAGFLILSTRIDLHKTAYQPTGISDRARDGAGKLWAVDGFDHVEYFNGLSDFVGLQRPDEVQFDIAMAVPQGGPLVHRFLNPVFAKNTLSGIKGRQNPLSAKRFADSNKRDVIYASPGRNGGFSQSALDGGQV